MDAISAGASVLAFITLAIQSAKTISVLLTDIKDAPDNVQRTAEAEVKTCSDNLAAFASRLGRLHTLDTDGRGRRVWKRVKAVIDVKELDKMTGIMAAHSSALSLSLQSTQIAVLYAGREQISRFSQDMSGDIARADARREEQWSYIRTTLAQQTRTICDATRTSSNEQLRDIQAIAAALTRVETKVDQQDTENKLSRIWDILQYLAGYIQNRPDKDLQTKALKDDKLRGCINRLRNQANQENRIVSADDVDSIFDDLKYVLAAANDQCDELVNIKSLERIGGLLSSARMLSINGTEANTGPGDRIVQRDRRRKAYEMGDGTLTISILKTRRLTEATDQKDADDIEDFIAKVTYFPNNGTGSMFKATMTQQAFRDGASSSSIPRLQVNLVLPRDSLVLTKRYSRAHFRQLWEGREHLCPYPEDLEDAGSDGAHQFDAHGENSDADDSNDSDADDSDTAAYKRCVRCKTPRMRGPQCRRCGWSFGCRDPHCGYCSDSDDSSAMEGESSPELQEEDYEMPEAPPSDPTAEAWPGALRAESSTLIPGRSLDHLSVGVEIQHWLGDMASLDSMETQGRGVQSSIPIIELENPWADAEGF